MKSRGGTRLEILRLETPRSNRYSAPRGVADAGRKLCKDGFLHRTALIRKESNLTFPADPFRLPR